MRITPQKLNNYNKKQVPFGAIDVDFLSRSSTLSGVDKNIQLERELKEKQKELAKYKGAENVKQKKFDTYLNTLYLSSFPKNCYKTIFTCWKKENKQLENEIKKIDEELALAKCKKTEYPKLDKTV